MKVNHNITSLQRRKIRVRKKVRGTAERPRLTVFRSNKHLYLQVINDEIGKTLVSANDVTEDLAKATKGKSKLQTAEVVIKELSEKLKNAKITKLVFDRGSYRYHGRVKLVAETLRQSGVQM